MNVNWRCRLTQVDLYNGLAVKFTADDWLVISIFLYRNANCPRDWKFLSPTIQLRDKAREIFQISGGRDHAVICVRVIAYSPCKVFRVRQLRQCPALPGRYQQI